MKTLATKQAISLKPEFIMNEDDINFLSSLPHNLPETHLTRKQISEINELYYKYISKNNVHYGWGTELYKLEQKEKWTGGSRVKTHEAQRMILGWLKEANEYHPTLSWREAAKYFHAHLTCREASAILTSKIYNTEDFYK
jgi:hypothetical protein